MQVFRTIAVVLAFIVGLGSAAPVALNTQQAQAPNPAPQTKTVYITKTGKKYHRDGCGSLAKSKIETTLAEAKKRGYTACALCYSTKK